MYRSPNYGLKITEFKNSMNSRIMRSKTIINKKYNLSGVNRLVQ